MLTNPVGSMRLTKRAVAVGDWKNCRAWRNLNIGRKIWYNLLHLKNALAKFIASDGINTVLYSVFCSWEVYKTENFTSHLTLTFKVPFLKVMWCWGPSFVVYVTYFALITNALKFSWTGAKTYFSAPNCPIRESRMKKPPCLCCYFNFGWNIIRTLWSRFLFNHQNIRR